MGNSSRQPSSINHATDSALLYIIKKCNDFDVSGVGDNKEWDKTGWTPFTLLQKDGLPYASKSKMMYSEKGLYLLFWGEDKKITTQNWNDGENIYDGDVFEVFFHPDPTKPPYFEYEINPLRKELILTLARFGKNSIAWSPWSGENKEDKLIKREVKINGGKQEIGASITSWTAELFFPYQVLALLPNSPPVSGTVWDANFCRIDYDNGKQNEYSWSPTMLTGFHSLQYFQKIKFE
ncbi:MAG: carbohydrate-binding family 9-like protein [Flavitalea sp.]